MINDRFNYHLVRPYGTPGVQRIMAISPSSAAKKYSKNNSSNNDDNRERRTLASAAVLLGVEERTGAKGKRGIYKPAGETTLGILIDARV